MASFTFRQLLKESSSVFCTAMGILGQYIIVFLLTLITFGIYSPWGTVRINKYVYSHTHVQQ